MVIEVLSLNDLTTEPETQSDNRELPMEELPEPDRQAFAPGKDSREGREIYTRARAIFKRASRTRGSRSAAIL